jgi:2-oxoacid:acceptor oxidoreductase gamma subunit (pyruvate/2-ketoisovalerate family)/2-oxoacid:acceptor oxidoreductase delta subunit (pyruvate/2-ketoisovalerate family)
VLAFARFGQERLRVRTQVYEPHFVVVLDESLIETVDVLAGLRPGGIVVVNTTRSPDHLVLSKKAKSATVDATSIALQYTKQAAVNTAMLGAFAKATGLITIEGVEAGILEVFGRRLSKEIADRNVAAARAAYEATRLGEGDSGRVYPKASKWLPGVQELPAGLATPALETPFGRVGVGSSPSNRTGGWRVSKPILDGSKCTNCLLCWFYCPDGSITRGDKIVDIHYDYCKGCGVCAAVCAPKAIHMERELEEEVKA